MENHGQGKIEQVRTPNVSWTVDQDNYFSRIDKFLRHVLRNVPLSAIYKLLRTGKVRINGRRAKSVSERLEIGDRVEVVGEDLTRYSRAFNELRPAQLALDIIYEDESLLAISKPAGLSVHPGHGVTKPSLLEGVMFYANERGFEPFLVHRLDKDTSGVIVVAKSRQVARELSELFASKKVEKTYRALIFGELRREVSIDEPIDDLEAHTVVFPDGVYMLTLGSQELYVSYVRVAIETGRKHQIRKHLASIGRPIVCDSQYGNFKLNRLFAKQFGLDRQFLHCESLRFSFQGKIYTLRAELTEDLKNVLFQLKTSSQYRGGGRK